MIIRWSVCKNMPQLLRFRNYTWCGRIFFITLHQKMIERFKPLPPLFCKFKSSTIVPRNRYNGKRCA